MTQIQRILIGSTSSDQGAPGDETAIYYYQEGDRLITECWGRFREEDPNEIISELFYSLHVLRHCSDPVDISRKAKYDHLTKQIIARYNLNSWIASYGDRTNCTVYATDRDKAWQKAAKLGYLLSLH